jgi:hypothetical protein
MKLCTRRLCVRPLAEGQGDGWCPTCRAERREDRAALLAAGLCPRCVQRERETGRAACSVCLDVQRERDAHRRSLRGRKPSHRRIGGLR